MQPRSNLAAVLGVFLATLVALAAYGFAHEFPVPRVHDEFAYLLSADTFAQGRLTNPTHPLWVHFDTYHVFHEPTYQAKYPPGQGASLALGQVLLGHPAWGVWIALAAGLAASTWMLMAVMPAGWAALGPLLLLTNALVFTRWGETYWGGGMALLGGALFGGGLLRCLSAPRIGAASLAGLGLFLLANTRPAEGALVCVLTLPVWFACLFRSPAGAAKGKRLLLPLGIALAVTLGFSALYNHALTGDALRPPYLHWDKYVSPHDVIQHYAGSLDPTPARKVARLGRFYFGSVLVWVLPLLLLRPSRVVLGAASLVLVVAGASVLGSRAWPHYLAPVAPWAVLLTVEALRRLAAARLAGRVAVLLLVALHLVLGAREVLRTVERGPLPAWSHARRSIAADLTARGGAHLVLVRYAAGHLVHEEWVYNAADIDAAPVIWARDLGDEGNRDLSSYFRDRTWWRVEPGRGAPELRPWSAPDDGAAREGGDE